MKETRKKKKDEPEDKGGGPSRHSEQGTQSQQAASNEGLGDEPKP